MPDEVTEEVKEEVIEEVTEEEVKEEAKKEEVTSDEDSEEASQALELYKSLKGPEGRTIIANLAKRAGLIKEEDFTKLTEVKKTKAVKDVIKDALGTEYEFLADRLGGALDEIIHSQMEAIEARFTLSAKEAANQEADTALNKVNVKFKDFKKFETQIYDLMQSMPFTGKGKLTMENYLIHLYNIAKNGNEKDSSSSDLVRTVDKMKENAQDANLVSSDVSSSRVKRGPVKPTLDEALEAASKGIRFA